MVLTDNCVLYYSLDDADISGTTVTDLSGTGNNGTINGADTGATGVLNECLDFVAANSDWLDTNYDPGTVYSISVWAYIPATVVGQAIIGIRNSSGSAGTREFNFGNYVSNGGIYLQYYNASNGSAGLINTSVTPDAWHHFVITRSGNNVELYVDGQTPLTNSTTGKYDPAQNIIVGKLGEQNIQHWDEKIDELGVWTRVLDSSEVSELYNSGSGYNPYAVASGRTQSLALGGGL